jgi:hypothetical protein
MERVGTLCRFGSFQSRKPQAGMYWSLLVLYIGGSFFWPMYVSQLPRLPEHSLAYMLFPATKPQL